MRAYRAPGRSQAATHPLAGPTAVAAGEGRA